MIEALQLFKQVSYGATGREPIFYLASPYTHHDSVVRDERYTKARRMLTFLHKRLLMVFSPVVHSHPVNYDFRPGSEPSWSHWMKLDLPFLHMSDALLILALEGIEKSEGVANEIVEARKKNLPIFFLPESMML